MAGIIEDAFTQVITTFASDNDMKVEGEQITGTFDARELAKIFKRAVSGEP